MNLNELTLDDRNFIEARKILRELAVKENSSVIG